MKKILSIVVPSYNTAKFIDKNIPTLLDKSILDDLEVLIINDGSKDETAIKAQSYADCYANTVKVINKENGGHGSVINRGIDIACGVYFKIVDGDDWVDTQNLCRLVRDLKTQDADLVLNPYNKVHEKTGKITRIVLAKGYGKEMAFENVCADYPQLEIPSITIKTSLLKCSGIRIRENCSYEDSEYDMFPTPFIKTVTILDYPIYQYLVDQSSQSISAANAFKNREMSAVVLKDCIEYYERWKDDVAENKRIYMFNVIIKLIRTQYNIYLRNGSKKECFEEFIKFNDEFKLHYPDYYREVGNRCQYIHAVQSNNIIVFKAISALVRCYKRGK